MIQRVYEQVEKSIYDVYVATDDERIFNAVKDFGGNAIMTSTNHRSGTDRCNEAFSKINKSFDVVINIQGDEPFIYPEQIDILKSCFADSSVEIATLVKAFEQKDGFDALTNPSTPKVALSNNSDAIYFSRSIIPYLRDVKPEEWLRENIFYKHIGVYGYRSDVLNKITQLPPGILEKSESLEQLRWLENGFKIKAGITKHETQGIDTPEDLEAALKLMHDSE